MTSRIFLLCKLFLAGLIALAAPGGQAQTNGASAGRFTRGTGNDPSYQSFVVPLDFQQGVTAAPALTTTLSNFSRTALYHLDATNSANQNYVANRIAFTNAIAAFGSGSGGSPLYFNRAYRFGAYAGNPGWTVQTRTNAFLITATDKATGTNLWLVPYTVPIPTVSNSWSGLLGTGDSTFVVLQGMLTLFSLTTDDPWGAGTDGAVVLTHIGSGYATNYEYTVWVQGATDKGYMVQSSDTSAFWLPLYTLDFDQRPAWQATFVSEPQFQGKPMPSEYAGKSLAELLAVQATVTNGVSSAATNWLGLDNSPELRQHPTLDQFVTDMGSNALALASYVFNEIELADAVAHNDNGNLAEVSVNLGGVNRGALGTFMEGQGSPVEQCALLVYLLRRAGVPAAYIFAPDNGVQMLDARLSRLLRMQIRGAVNYLGQTYTTNALIPVNYVCGNQQHG